MKSNTFKLVLVVFALAIMVGNVQAQQSAPPPPVNSWVIGADVAPGSMVHITGLSQPTGIVVDQKKDVWVTAFIGYKPLGGLGLEVRFTTFGGASEGAGSVAQTDSPLVTWGVNATPKIVSSAPVLNGPVAYTLKSSAKISRVDLLGNYTRGFQKGWISVFAGVPILKVEAMEDISRKQNFLLYARLPNSQLDTIGNREDYNFSSMAMAKATKFGLAGGIEGEVCLIGNLVLEGRASVAMFPWGSAKNDGQFSATKDIYLVAVAGGVSATPMSTLAHLNWAPNSLPYAEAVKQSVTAIDVKVGLKWRVRVGERATLNLGVAISRSSLSNMPTTAGYVISDPYAVGSGRFSSRTTTMSVWAPMATIGIWF